MMSKRTHPYLFLFLSVIALIVNVARAQDTANAFQTAITAYQKIPTAEAASKVIQLAKQLPSPPAVPEEARRNAVMGATILKEARDPETAAKAAKLFVEAVKLAPWWREARWNLVLAEESAGQLNSATSDLKLYQEFDLSETDRRQALDKLYALEAKSRLAADKEAKDVVARQRAQEDSKLLGFVGHWSWDKYAMKDYLVIERRGNDLLLSKESKHTMTQNTPKVEVNGQQIRIECVENLANVVLELNLSDDGSTLEGRHYAYQTPEQQAKEPGYHPPPGHAVQFKKQ